MSFMTQTNRRTDEYSAHDNPLHLLHQIVTSIRAPGVVPQDFVLGVKLNAADYVDSSQSGDAVNNPSDTALDEERPLKHIQEIASWGMVDFIEVSGGDYESPGKHCLRGCVRWLVLVLGRPNMLMIVFSAHNRLLVSQQVSSPSSVQSFLSACCADSRYATNRYRCTADSILCR